MSELTAWVNTRAALKNFMQLLACNKCKQRPTEPVRYIDCQHLFCFNCVKQDTNCFVCGVPVRPADIRPDHITSTLVAGCDSIAEIIFSDGDKETEEDAKLGEETQGRFGSLSDIFSSTRLSADVNKETIYKKKPDVIFEESDASDQTEKMEDSDDDDDTVRINDSEEFDNLRSTANSIPRNIVAETGKLKKPVLQSQSSSRKNFKKIPKDVNKKNKKGETLLHQACVKRQEDTVKLLLDHGANPNTKDHANWTPLQEAVNMGLYKICEMLLEKGALPDTPGIDNKTALHEAAQHNRYKEAALLLRYDANPNVFDQHGKKPIDYCTSDAMKKLFSQDNLLNESREKLNDVSCSLNRSVGSLITKIVVLACNLNQSTYASLMQLTTKHKIRVTNSFVPNVTHVIVESDEQYFTKLNYDLLLSILHGKWILSSAWIQIGLSPECKDLREIDLDVFEMKCLSYDSTPARARINAEKQNPGLFNNCFFFFALNSTGSYEVGDISLTKKSLIKLITEGGGTSLSREPNPEDIQDTKKIPFHIANDKTHPLHNCSHYIIYAPEKEEPRIKYNMPHIKTLPLVWLIECIEKFTLVDPALFGIM